MNTPIYIYDLSNCRADENDKPIFWVGELGRFIGFDEMEYDVSYGHWYVALKGAN